MTPQELHDKLGPSITATLEALRHVLDLHGVPSRPVEDLSSPLDARSWANLGWAFIIPIGETGDQDIGVLIDVLLTNTMCDEVPADCLNFELLVSARNGETMCAYQPCKFTSEQWVSVDDGPAIDARYAIFAAFCDGCVQFIADHVRVRSVATEESRL